ncbi:MAG: hypothetical protein H7070_01495 [Saprospiraceae bacterium]|nr:hypothetical protein [Pyrinomonadaceae bacterium]
MQKSLSFGYLAIILLFGLLSYAAWSVWRGAEDSAYRSCLESVGNIIQIKFSDNSFEPQEYAGTLLPKNASWKILSESEAEFLVNQIKGSDCSRFNNPANDPWDKTINIALRKSAGLANIIIWSNGQDGKSGTSDDLVVPYGSVVPQ